MIPAKIIKQNKNLLVFCKDHNFNNSLSNSYLANAMKYAGVAPVFKQHDKTDKENYIPVSIFPALSKVNPFILYDLSQGFILGPLLFVDTNHLDNTPYVC